MKRKDHKLKQLSDEECWARLQSGCKDSLEQLYFRYYDSLYGYAVGFCGSRAVAEDHIQSLFLKIWDRKESLNHVEYVKTYLWVSLRRSLLDEQTRENRVGGSGIGIRNERDFHFVSSPEEIHMTKERNSRILQDLYEAIQELNPRQREILYLKFFEGMSYSEIQEITSLRYQTVRNYIYEAVKILKSTLGEKQGFQTSQLSLAVISEFFVLLFLQI